MKDQILKGEGSSANSSDVPLGEIGPKVQIYAVMSEHGDYEAVSTGNLEMLTDQDASAVAHYLEVQKDGEVMLRSRLRSSIKYERQKNSVICWTDQQQPLYEDLAISFVDDTHCDFYWRLICERTGQNYLNINPHGIIELPTLHNLAQILEKLKKEKDVAHFYIRNSPEFLLSLVRLLKEFQEQQDIPQQTMICRIVSTMVASADLSLLQILFTDPGFTLLLEEGKFALGIDIPSIFAASFKLQTLIDLPQEISTKVQVIHRAKFYRQFVLNLASHDAVESVLLMIIKDYYAHILLFLAKEDYLDQAVAPQNEEEKQLGMLLQCFSVYRQVDSPKTRSRFLDKLYQSEITPLLKVSIDKDKIKSFEILLVLAETDALRFMEHLRNDFRDNPSNNLINKLALSYCKSLFQTIVLEVVRMLLTTFQRRKDLFDFFTGTFLCLVLGQNKNNFATVQIIVVLFEGHINVEGILGLLLKQRTIHMLAKQLPERESKLANLGAIKLLKSLLVESNRLSSKVNSPLRNLSQQVISSGYFDYCLQILQRNLSRNMNFAEKRPRDNMLISAMLECLTLIERLSGSPYHLHILTNYSLHHILSLPLRNLLKMTPMVSSQPPIQQESHVQEMENQRLESYLLGDGEDGEVKPELATSSPRMTEIEAMFSEITRQESQEKDRTGKRERPRDFVFDFIFEEKIP